MDILAHDVGSHEQLYLVVCIRQKVVTSVPQRGGVVSLTLLQPLDCLKELFRFGQVINNVPIKVVFRLFDGLGELLLESFRASLSSGSRASSFLWRFHSFLAAWCSATASLHSLLHHLWPVPLPEERVVDPWRACRSMSWMPSARLL